MLEELKKTIKGEVEADPQTINKYSHDNSLFEVKPQGVVFPKDVEDVKKIVKYVSEHKKTNSGLSITGRSGGSDMSGGAINDSLIVDFHRHLNSMGQVKKDSVKAQPGIDYVTFENNTIKKNLIMPSYPASRELADIGGLVMNNSGGEKSLTFGKTERFVKRVKMVLADGNEYEFKPLTKEQLDDKMKQKDFEGAVYRGIYRLVNKNYRKIKNAKPNVTKNSTGYNLWNIWDKEAGVFDMTQLFVGSQGTLGLLTEVELGLVNLPKHSGVLVGYAENLDHLAEMVKVLLDHNPVTIEAFDKHTLKFAFRFFLKFRKGIGWIGLIKLALQLIPDGFILARMFPKTPEMIFMASYESDDYDEIKRKLDELRDDIRVNHWKISLEEAETESKSMRFWLMRRKSFKLLRDNVRGGKHTAPFIDDVVCPPENLPKFWPEIVEILERYEFLYTIAGHLGDGNFHIIPLMNLSDPKERAKIEPALHEVIQLVKKYGGVISGEHNDGLIRSPFLEEIYGKEVVGFFAEAKQVLDPQNIFNPHKKTDGDWKWSKRHMRASY